MASLLAEAEQQGLIDVFLVMVTRHEALEVPADRKDCSMADRVDGAEVYQQQTTVDHWRRLDGTNPEWKQELLEFERGDCILQVISHVGLCS